MRKNLSAKVESKVDSCVQARVNALRREREAGSEAATNEQEWKKVMFGVYL